MKHKNLYLSMVILTGLMLFTSCKKDVPEQPPENPEPTEYTFIDCELKEVVEGATTRTITLKLGSSSQYLAVDFISSLDNNFLAPGVYTIAEQENAKAGNYVAGKTRWVGYLATLPLIDGNILVELDNDVYNITGTVTLEDRSIITFIFTGAIKFEPEPPITTSYTYSVEVQVPAMGGPDPMSPQPIAGSQLNKISVFDDGVLVAYFEVVTAENATSLAGSYTVKDGVDAFGQLKTGISIPAWGIEDGSYYIENGVKMFIRQNTDETPVTVTITDNAGVLSITGNDLPIQDVANINYDTFTFPNLPEKGSIDIQNATNGVSGGDGTFTYSVEVQAPYAWTTDGQNYTTVDGSQLNKIRIFADNIPVAYFEIVTEENRSSLAGTYPVSEQINDVSGAVVKGVYIDLSEFVPELIIEDGSYLLNGDNKQFINAGELTITDNGGVLTFTSSNLAILDIVTGQSKPDLSSIHYANATPKGGSGGDDGTYTNLFFAEALDLSQFGLTGFTVTLKVATSDLTTNVTPGAMGPTITYAGSGQYISFDFSTATAELPVGTYNVVNNMMAQVGDCLAGYDSFFGAGFMGTFVGNVVDGTPTEEVITGGTVDVSAEGISFNLTTASETISGSYIGVIILQ